METVSPALNAVIGFRCGGPDARERETTGRAKEAAASCGGTRKDVPRAHNLSINQIPLWRPPHLASLGSPRRTCVPWGPLLLFSRRRPCSIFAILVRGAAAYVLLLRLIFRSIDLLPSPLLFLQFVEIGKVPSHGMGRRRKRFHHLRRKGSPQLGNERSRLFRELPDFPS